MTESEHHRSGDGATELPAAPGFGDHVRQARRAKAWTLEHLARRSGVSRAMLSKVERGEKNPTIRVAKLIASALELPFSRLVAGTWGKPAQQRVIRASERSRFRDEETGFTREVILADDGSGTEVVRHELPAGIGTDWLPAQPPGSRKRAIVEQGVLTIRLGDVTHRLEAGDAIAFAADVAHAFENKERTDCRYLLAITVPG